ncbi:MAG: DNA polymerase I [Patescibacteria group bacterium]|nr:DNA polymerase I [Patescibacteria group bacterium]
MTKKEKLVIIDGNALIHRAFHALPPTLTTKKGELVNAVYGFTSVLLKVLNDLKPDYVAATFDLAGPTFRDKMYKEYKATRVKADQSLYDQIPRVKEVVKAFNIPIFEKKGFEADDLIGTIVSQITNHKSQIESIVVTGDLDTLQLVNKSTKVFTLKKGVSDEVIYDEKAVKQRFGFGPKKVVDYKALRGDPSDNIPGVKGVGQKTATKLIKEYGCLEKIYKNIDKIKERWQKLLKENKKEAELSKKLATINCNVPLKFNLKKAKIHDYDRREVVELFQKLEFKSMLNRLPEVEKGKGFQGKMPLGSENNQEKRKEKAKDLGLEYKLIDKEKDLIKLIEALKRQKEVCFDTETTSFEPLKARLLGISFSFKGNEAYFVSVVKLPKAIEKLKPILENEKILKYAHNIKYDYSVMKQAGVEVKPLWFDSMIAAYLINPGVRQYNLDSLVFSELGYEMQPMTALIGKKGKNQLLIEKIPLEKLSWYSCEDADFTFKLSKKLDPELDKKNLDKLFHEMEMPLVRVLAEMEEVGVKIDSDYLAEMSQEVRARLSKIRKEIYKLAGCEFNINSPLQLRKILFEELKISAEGISRTKTGISTAASELEKMKDRHPIINLISEHRELSKLKSTYLEALPKLVNKKTGRVHTSYNQTIVATGRLSSSKPNLQNIPVRTKLGAKIRNAFIPEKGYKILKADYSQIELRVVASLSGDEKMINSFKKGEDIHTRTAAIINEVPLDKVTKKMRYAAKATNFGIIYGLGVYGLSSNAGISLDKARDFIERYFSLYEGVADFLETSRDQAFEEGYNETLFGRRRYYPEIQSGNKGLKAAAERAAINHPVQGTAADIIKLAMIKIDKELPRISSKSKMIMQVHDELVFEVPEKELSKVSKFVKETMENIHKLKVPIVVDIESGQSWGECD